MASKTNPCKVADLSLTAFKLGEGMKILCIKDHVRSSINDFRERIRAITNAKEKKKKMMNRRSLQSHCSCVFAYFESIIVYSSTRRTCCLSEKA